MSPDHTPPLNAQPLARRKTDWMPSLARKLAADTQIEDFWLRVVQASTSEIEGAEHSGITVVEGKSVSTPAATDDLVRLIDQHQYATGEGPCLTAALDHQPVVSAADLSTDTRWPQFSAAIRGLPVRSMLSFQLYTDSDTIGAMNMYSSRPNAFTDQSVEIGSMLAAHAALAAAASGRTANLRIALATRDVIGQAKGILMERYKITGEQAFDLLISASQHTNRKLKDIADDLAATGEFGSR